ncbi:MAG: TetR family transcriptional regulator [Coriobacteriales bacterium]|nr:TetR family transcriptional regulator [Coriobacteriales bacterium]
MTDRTKLWIAEALRRLLVNKPIEEVRVTEICREAEVARPTFYYHFEDKYDLMAWMICQSALNTDVLNVESAAEALNSMRRDYAFYKRAYEDRSQSPMWAYMLEYFVRRYTVLYEELSGDEPGTQAAFAIRLYCYGTLGMTREWLLQDNITPAEVAVEMMFASMPQALRRVYFGLG